MERIRREKSGDHIEFSSLHKQQQQQQGRKQTDRLAVHQLEDSGGPDDDYDGSCGHKENTAHLLTSPNDMQMMGDHTRNVPLKEEQNRGTTTCRFFHQHTFRRRSPGQTEIVNFTLHICRRTKGTAPADAPLLTDNREDEGVGEVLIQREFHYVSAQLQQTSGLRQADENVDNVKENTLHTHSTNHQSKGQNASEYENP